LQAFGLLSLILFCLILTSIMGGFILMLFSGIRPADILAGFGDLNESRNINILKGFQVINQIGVFILPSLAFAFLASDSVPDYLRLKNKTGFTVLLLSVIMILTVMPFINWLVLLNERMDLPSFLDGAERWMRASEDEANRITDAFLADKTIQGLFANLLVIGLFAAIGEELLFRGVLIRLLTTGMGNVHAAILVSAVLFSSLHLQFYGFVPRLALGVLFGYLFIWAGTLWLPILVHFVFNATAVVVMYLYNNSLIGIDMNSFATTENLFIIAASLAFSAGLLFMIHRKCRIADNGLYKTKKETP
jgi:membrane protease YdiL (CAAX protease family)